MIPNRSASASQLEELSPVGVELRVKIDSRYRPHDANDRPYMAGSLSSDECNHYDEWSVILVRYSLSPPFFILHFISFFPCFSTRTCVNKHLKTHFNGAPFEQTDLCNYVPTQAHSIKHSWYKNLGKLQFATFSPRRKRKDICKNCSLKIWSNFPFTEGGSITYEMLTCARNWTSSVLLLLYVGFWSFTRHTTTRSTH